VTGGCRCDEITSLTMADIEDLGTLILIKLQDTKHYKSRSFIIMEKFYLEICRKYISIRKDINISRFLLNYHDGKCANMVMGKHKIASAPREIASFLKLPNSNEYTGHCLRRTSATLFLDNGGDISALQRHGSWHSTPVAESYIEDSTENREQTAVQILAPLDINKPSTSDNLDRVVDDTIKIEGDSDDTEKRELRITGGIKIENCKFENCDFTVTRGIFIFGGGNKRLRNVTKLYCQCQISHKRRKKECLGKFKFSLNRLKK
jgi:hypothetical protein